MKIINVKGDYRNVNKRKRDDFCCVSKEMLKLIISNIDFWTKMYACKEFTFFFLLENRNLSRPIFSKHHQRSEAGFKKIKGWKFSLFSLCAFLHYET